MARFSKSNLPKQLFINNEYVDSKHNKKLSLFNPNDGSLVADDVALAGESDVDLAVDAAHQAFPAWRKLSAIARREILSNFTTLLEEHRDGLVELTRITLGAPCSTFGRGEVSMAIEAFKYYTGWVDKFAGESYPQEDGYLKIVRNEPLGVTAGIIPWNAPLGSMALKAAPALATGNCIIIKPSEKTPFAALALGLLIKAAGFPPGVFQVLSGDGSTGALLSSHMRIRKVSFTGSVPTGKKIQELAAKSNLKRVTLELGGKSPAVVFEDCNFENTVTLLADALTTNTGQICFAATRVYVQEGIYSKFVLKYKEAIEERSLQVGDPEKEATKLGPLCDQDQFQKVSGFIERGQKGQGKLLTGGHRIGNKGYFIEPTVFVDVKTGSEIATQEIFGPVSVLQPFKTEEEIVARSNDSEFGLMAGVFTQDINKALRVASDFDSGMVGINCVSMLFMNSPFGGSKQSGMGRECGLAACKAFTEPKTIFINMNY